VPKPKVGQVHSFYTVHHHDTLDHFALLLLNGRENEGADFLQFSSAVPSPATQSSPIAADASVPSGGLQRNNVGFFACFAISICDVI
jgi:hypothetical protein